MRELESKLDNEVKEIFPLVRDWRRYLHRYPELSLEEHETGKFLLNLAREFIDDDRDEIHYPIGTTGLLVILHVDEPKGKLLFRADMDALPIKEETGLEFSSRNEGVMHACGHDLHMASLLGLLKVAVQMRRRGELKLDLGFLFQPGEEGGFGAKRVIEDGLFDKFNADAVLGAHVWTAFPVGTVGVAAGPIMAAYDGFKITLRGPGGHASAPHTTVDLTAILGHLITALYTMASREVNPMNPSVLTIGYVHGGTVNNVIPREYVLGGTVRTYYHEDRERLRRRIREVAEGIVTAMSPQEGIVEVSVELEEGYPVTRNSEELTKLMLEIVRRRGFELADPRGLGAEDFAYYGLNKPSLYVIVGADNGESTPHHSPKFNPDERAMMITIQLFKDFIEKFAV